MVSVVESHLKTLCHLFLIIIPTFFYVGIPGTSITTKYGSIITSEEYMYLEVGFMQDSRDAIDHFFQKYNATSAICYKRNDVSSNSF